MFSNGAASSVFGALDPYQDLLFAYALTFASQNEQIRMCDWDKHDIKSKVFFLLPVQSQLPHIHEKLAAAHAWFPSVSFSQLTQ